MDEIVRAHDGTISVSSEFGKGSKFIVNFPLVIIKDEMQTSDGTRTMLSYKIMVVEDDLNLANLLKHELQDSGFQVSHFSSGQKALEQFRKLHQTLLFWIFFLKRMELMGGQ